jgi:hypothetical protein
MVHNRGKEMTSHWSTVNDDELRMTDKAVEFLQGEFCPPPGADPMWSTEYFRWKLGSSNPAGRGYISLAMLDDRVIGTSSLVKKRLLINGNECIGGEVQDAYSAAAIRHSCRPMNLSPKDPDPNSYINKSIFGRLASEVRERADADGISVIYGTANYNSYRSYVNEKKLRFFDFKGFQIESFARPTLKLVSRKYPSLSFLSAPLRNIETFWISLQKNIYNRGLCKSFTSDISVPSAAELDELWIRLKPVNGFSLIRDASYWRHRYMDHPIAKYNFFVIREGGQLVGVVVTRLFLAGGGKRVVAIAEWMNDERIPFGYVLSEVLNYYRDSGVESFNLWAGRSTQESRAASRSLFFSRRRVPIIFADTPQARSLQTMAANIKFYLGSSDNV